MRFNADVNKRVVVYSAELPWSLAGGERYEEKLLESDGRPDGWSSSLVRCPPGLMISDHGHPGGEEFFVLEGSIEDELGRYTAGTYVRNPPGSWHKPKTEDGCVIFVKVWQSPPNDGQRLVVDTAKCEWLPGMRNGTSVIPLYRHGAESAALCRWEPSSDFYPHRHVGGEEILVISGALYDEHGVYPRGTWLRNPSYSAHHLHSRQGCVFYIKTGHLAAARG